MAATAEEIRRAIHGKTIEAPTGRWCISVLNAQMDTNSTRRILKLSLVGTVAFNLRLEIAGEALLQLYPDQDLGSWVLEKLSTYLAFNNDIHSGESRVCEV